MKTKNYIKYLLLIYATTMYSQFEQQQIIDANANRITNIINDEAVKTVILSKKAKITTYDILSKKNLSNIK